MKKPTRFLAALGLVAVAAFGLLVWRYTRGAVYYVSPTGSGTACTLADPCLPTTPTLAPGDLVLFGDGTYNWSDVVRASGTSSAYVEYRALNPQTLTTTPEAQTPTGAIIRGGNTPTNRSYWTVRGFYIDGRLGTGSAVALGSGTHHVRIIDNELRGLREVDWGDLACSEGDSLSGSGVAYSGASADIDFVEVLGNNIHGFYDAISVSCVAQGWVIRDNFIHQTFNGVKYNNAPGDTFIEDNVFWEVPNHLLELGNDCGGAAIPPDSHAYIRRNVIAGGQEAAYGDSGRAYTVTNNTFFGPDPDKDGTNLTCTTPMPGMAWLARAGVPFVTVGPIVFKNNLMHSDAVSDPLIQLENWSMLQASNYNWNYRPMMSSTGSGESEFGVAPGVANNGPYTSWRDTCLANGKTECDQNSVRGVNPQFFGGLQPFLRPVPTSIAEARNRVRPVTGSPACTAGEGGTYVGAVPCSQFQYARPDFTLAAGLWQDGNAPGQPAEYSLISEATADDAASYASSVQTTSTFRVRLSDVVDPQTSAGHIMRWRYRRDPAGSGTGGGMQVELFQGSTPIVAASPTNFGADFALFTTTLTAAQADAITDYSALEVRFTCTPGPGLRSCELTWFELEVPGPGGVAPDTTPPAQITNLSASGATSNSVSLTWTAPGDDGTTGTATAYDIRYVPGTTGCFELDSESEWTAASQATGEPTPAIAGTAQGFTVPGLTPATPYCFAIRARDEVPNTGAISNRVLQSTSAAPSGSIGCTEAEFRQAITDACSGSRPSTITFSCSNTVIPVAAQFEIPASCPSGPITIDMGSKGIVFESSPPWWDVVTCGGGNCDPDGDNIPNGCSDSNTGPRFLIIRSTATVRGGAFRYFNKGIIFDGNGGLSGSSGSLIEDVTGDLQGDDSFNHEAGATNNTLRRVTATRGCDKCVQIYGRDPRQASGYDLTIEDSVLRNCVQPILVAGPGSFAFRRTTFTDDGGAGALWFCDGPQIDSADVYGLFEDVSVSNCRQGLRIGSGEARVVGGTFANNERRGISVYNGGRLSLQGATLTANGGFSGSVAQYGGVSINDTAQADLGGGSVTLWGSVVNSTGGNTFTGNRSETDPTLDVQNNTATQVKAENNCWGDPDPSDQVSGSVDWDPVCSVASNPTLSIYGGCTVSSGGVR